jgi:type IV pilus assembly protein PilV
MTLVEVLVTLVLISVGLLGVAALQLTTLKNNQESYVRSQAAMLAADILDRMRSN